MKRLLPKVGCNMVELPENTVTAEDLSEWYRMQEELKKLKSREMLLRSKIFKFYFPNPDEGTNNHNMSDGYVLKGKHTINREIDPGAFQVLRKNFEAAGIHPDALVQYKPSLVKREYNTLTEEQKRLFDQALIVKPGSPALEIVLPKKRGAAGTQHAGDTDN